MSESTSSQQQPPGGTAAPPYGAEYLGAPGVRFAPKYKELILNYLQPRLRGEELPTNAVHDDNVYREHPKDLVSRLGEGWEDKWYVFSPRHRCYPKGGRPSRFTGDAGLWKASGKNKCIHAGKGADGEPLLIGHKHEFSYYEFTGESQGKNKVKKKTDWRMAEFISCNSNRPIQSAEDPMLLNDRVLCQIWRRDREEEAKKKQEKDLSGHKRKRSKKKRASVGSEVEEEQEIASVEPEEEEEQEKTSVGSEEGNAAVAGSSVPPQCEEWFPDDGTQIPFSGLIYPNNPALHNQHYWGFTGSSADDLTSLVSSFGGDDRL